MIYFLLPFLGLNFGLNHNATASVSALVEKDEYPYKVVGRGFYNQKYQMLLQLACVGDFIVPAEQTLEPVMAELDRKCDRLQFVITSTDGTQALMGPIFKVTDEKSDPRIIKQLEMQFKVSGLGRDMTRQRKWAVTRYFYGSGNTKHVSDQWGGVLFVGSVFASAKFHLFLEATGMVTGLGLFGTTIASAFAFPLVFDAVTLPITAFLDVIEGNNALGVKARSIDVLQDRSKYSWQFKAEKMSNKKFEYLLSRLMGLCDQNTKPKKIKYSQNQIVLIPKTSRYGYEFKGNYGVLKKYWIPGEWQVKPLLKADRKKYKNGRYWPAFTESELDRASPQCDKIVGE